MPTINIEISEKCISRCAGCCNNFTNSTNKFIDIENLDKFLFAASKTCDRVTLCGGDPLLHPQILEVLKICKKYKYKVHLDTTGLPLLQDDYIGIQKIEINDIKPYIDSIGVCYDGSKDEIACIFRTGYHDFVNKQKRIIELLDKNGINTCINTVVFSGNKENLFDIYNDIRYYSCIKEWQLFEFAPIGDFGYRNRKIFEISDYNDVINKLMKRIKRTDFIITQKSNSKRKEAYVIIRVNGDADMPYINGNSHKHIGNITNLEDHETIIENILRCSKRRKSEI